MSNPLGINQYTRHGAGKLRTKTGKFYHGTPSVFTGRVRNDPGYENYATSNLRGAAKYAKGSSGRVLVVSVPSKKTKMYSAGRQGSEVVAKSLRTMSVVGVLPTLRKPSRK